MMNKTAISLCIGAQVVFTGCAPLVLEEDHPCPCSDQWVCCAGANVCVPQGAQCPSVDSGPPGSDAGMLYGPDSGAPGVGPDSGVPVEASADSGAPVPAACANPGPFPDQPTATSLPSLIVGMWIACGNSWFAGIPGESSEGDVGIVFRADMTWQKLGVSGGQLVPLVQHYDYGTWSVYGGGCCGEMLKVAWDTSSLPSNPSFAADGQTLSVTTSELGNQATLAKVAYGAAGAADQ